MKAFRPLLPLFLLLSIPFAPHRAALVAAQEVIHLPEDGALWHTTLVLPDNPSENPAAKRLMEHFEKSQRLKQLVAQTTLHRFTPRDPLFSARYSPYFGGVLPALLVQKADGAVIYKVSGDAIPLSADALADEIAQAIDQCCPLRPRPQQPEPITTPEPPIRPKVPQVNVDVIPDIRPETPSSKPDAATPANFTPLLLLAPIVAAVLGYRRPARRGL